MVRVARLCALLAGSLVHLTIKRAHGDESRGLDVTDVFGCGGTRLRLPGLSAAVHTASGVISEHDCLLSELSRHACIVDADGAILDAADQDQLEEGVYKLEGCHVPLPQDLPYGIDESWHRKPNGRILSTGTFESQANTR